MVLLDRANQICKRMIRCETEEGKPTMASSLETKRSVAGVRRPVGGSDVHGVRDARPLDTAGAGECGLKARDGWCLTSTDLTGDREKPGSADPSNPAGTALSP